ncbi:hypothetical protein T01_12982 [Trichinella spiralis]|uniref:Uncharacterized protein n=1 Tax=Trichinella spiralis TaxID=6334 RepID=A0A0V1BVX7_TRISP|nr:hypothetical protein T01_12982 [Trichinella spiralis]
MFFLANLDFSGFAPAVNGSRRMYTDRAVQPIVSSRRMLMIKFQFSV